MRKKFVKTDNSGLVLSVVETNMPEMLTDIDVMIDITRDGMANKISGRKTKVVKGKLKDLGAAEPLEVAEKQDINAELLEEIKVLKERINKLEGKK